jgi:pimeloyl-ACP methyl ester carboxylesterase
MKYVDLVSAKLEFGIWNLEVGILLRVGINLEWLAVSELNTHSLIPNSNFPIPNSNFQIPNSNFQFPSMAPDTTIQQGYADVNGIRLHYAETGAANKKLVLLLHGFPEFWYSWRNQLSVLGERFHTIAPDMRGYNLSDKPARVEDYAIDVLVNDAIGLIDHFGADKAAIVGHDWGAGVAWAIAQQRPDRVSELAVMQVPPARAWRANLTMRQLLRSWYMFFFQLPRIPEWVISRNNFEGIERTFRERVFTPGAFTDEDIELYKEAMRHPGALTAAVNYYRANVGRLLFRGPGKRENKSIGRVPMPTLFIFGEQDFAIIPDTVRRVENFVSGPYRELRLPQIGHWVQNEAAAEVNKALIDFLEP